MARVFASSTFLIVMNSQRPETLNATSVSYFSALGGNLPGYEALSSTVFFPLQGPYSLKMFLLPFPALKYFHSGKKQRRRRKQGGIFFFLFLSSVTQHHLLKECAILALNVPLKDPFCLQHFGLLWFAQWVESSWSCVTGRSILLTPCRILCLPLSIPPTLLSPHWEFSFLCGHMLLPSVAVFQTLPASHSPWRNLTPWFIFGIFILGEPPTLKGTR